MKRSAKAKSNTGNVASYFSKLPERGQALHAKAVAASDYANKNWSETNNLKAAKAHDDAASYFSKLPKNLYDRHAEKALDYHNLSTRSHRLAAHVLPGYDREREEASKPADRPISVSRSETNGVSRSIDRFLGEPTNKEIGVTLGAAALVGGAIGIGILALRNK